MDIRRIEAYNELNKDFDLTMNPYQVGSWIKFVDLYKDHFIELKRL